MLSLAKVSGQNLCHLGVLPRFLSPGRVHSGSPQAGNAGGQAGRALGGEPLGLSSQEATGKAETFSFLCSCPPDIRSQLFSKVLMWNRI